MTLVRNARARFTCSTRTAQTTRNTPNRIKCDSRAYTPGFAFYTIKNATQIAGSSPRDPRFAHLPRVVTRKFVRVLIVIKHDRRVKVRYEREVRGGVREGAGRYVEFASRIVQSPNPNPHDRGGKKEPKGLRRENALLCEPCGKALYTENALRLNANVKTLRQEFKVLLRH